MLGRNGSEQRPRCWRPTARPARPASRPHPGSSAARPRSSATRPAPHRLRAAEATSSTPSAHAAAGPASAASAAFWNRERSGLMSRWDIPRDQPHPPKLSGGPAAPHHLIRAGPRGPMLVLDEPVASLEPRRPPRLPARGWSTRCWTAAPRKSCLHPHPLRPGTSPSTSPS